MKKRLTILCLCISVTSIYAQKEIAGIWEGKLNINSISLGIDFHIKKQPGNYYKTKMDSPDQGVRGIPCDSTFTKGDSIFIKLMGAAGFKGKIVNDSTMNGNWVQGTIYPMTLKKVNAVSVLMRPQTPKPPFDYNSEDVEYDNADKSIHYGATLTYPKGEGPFPTAILITGSGQQDRDETIFQHKPFAVIADYLTKRGYAVLRVDDRGKGKSTGDVMNANSSDFAKDVETSLAYIKGRKEIDKKRIGLIGHSEGGLIASIVATEDPTDINFIIMLAGPGVKGADLLYQQSIAIMKMGGATEQLTSAYGALYKKVEEDIMTEKDSAVYNKVLNDFTQWKKAQTVIVLDSLNIPTNDSSNTKIVSEFVQGFSSPWMKYFMQADPRPMIEKFKCKVLAIDGSKDIQVIEPDNLDAINSALKKSKSPSYETKDIPGLNHLFQHCQKCTIAEYAELEETFAPEALAIMGDWLDKNVGNK